MKKIFIGLLLMAGCTILFTACKKETGVELNDEEIITDVELTFVNQLTNDTLLFNYQDADGPGGLAPVQDSILLNANTNYKVSLRLYNKTLNPILDISEEIAEEADAHRFYYTASTNSGITLATTDVDGNAVPLGLEANVSAGNIGIGNLRIILRHYPGNPPDKAAADLENSPKSTTDVDISFGVRIK